MKETMRAARFYGANEPLRIEKIPIPGIGPMDVLIDVKASIIDGTVLNIVRGRFPVSKLPITLGWETSGEVAEVGSDVGGFRKGERVTLNHLFGMCGRCIYCITGRERICNNRGFLGANADGSFAEYLKVPVTNLYKLPNEIPFDQGAVLSDSLATAFNATSRGDIKPGDSVTIYGVGNVGMNAVQIARILGASMIIAVDIVDDKLKIAKELGADETINATEEDPVKRVKELTDGEGANVAIEMVGLKQTMEQTIKSVRNGGRVVLVGIGVMQNIEIDPLQVVTSEVEIVGSWGFNRTVLPMVIELVRKGRIDLSRSISARVSLDEINRGIEILEREKRMIGVLVAQY